MPACAPRARPHSGQGLNPHTSRSLPPGLRPQVALDPPGAVKAAWARGVQAACTAGEGHAPTPQAPARGPLGAGPRGAPRQLRGPPQGGAVPVRSALLAQAARPAQSPELPQAPGRDPRARNHPGPGKGPRLRSWTRDGHARPGLTQARWPARRVVPLRTGSGRNAEGPSARDREGRRLSPSPPHPVPEDKPRRGVRPPQWGQGCSGQWTAPGKGRRASPRLVHDTPPSKGQAIKSAIFEGTRARHGRLPRVTEGCTGLDHSRLRPRAGPRDGTGGGATPPAASQGKKAQAPTSPHSPASSQTRVLRHQGERTRRSPSRTRRGPGAERPWAPAAGSTQRARRRAGKQPRATPAPARPPGAGPDRSGGTPGMRGSPRPPRPAGGGRQPPRPSSPMLLFLRTGPSGFSGVCLGARPPWALRLLPRASSAPTGGKRRQ